MISIMCMFSSCEVLSSFQEIPQNLILFLNMQNDSMIAAIISLSDVDELNGGLRVYPGSHKLGRLKNSSGLEKSDELEQYPLENATSVNMKRGDILFFHYFTLHGSLPNRSDMVRKTVLVQMYAGHDFVTTGDIDHVNEQIVLRGHNHHMTRNKAKL